MYICIPIVIGRCRNRQRHVVVMIHWHDTYFFVLLVPLPRTRITAKREIFLHTLSFYGLWLRAHFTDDVVVLYVRYCTALCDDCIESLGPLYPIQHYFKPRKTTDEYEFE